MKKLLCALLLCSGLGVPAQADPGGDGWTRGTAVLLPGGSLRTATSLLGGVGPPVCVPPTTVTVTVGKATAFPWTQHSSGDIYYQWLGAAKGDTSGGRGYRTWASVQLIDQPVAPPGPPMASREEFADSDTNTAFASVELWVPYYLLRGAYFRTVVGSITVRGKAGYSCGGVRVTGACEQVTTFFVATPAGPVEYAEPVRTRC